MPLRTFTKIALALLLALALTAVPAGADPLALGHTKLELSRALYEKLRGNDIQVRRLGPAKVNRRFITLPASSGMLEARYGSGYLYYEGGIQLQLRKRKAVIDHLILNTAERWLNGTVGGRKLTIATVENTRAGWDGFDIGVALDLRLTRRAAKLLNRRLGLDGVLKGGPLAAADIVVRPETLTLSGGTIELSFDPGFRAKLDSLDVAISTAEYSTLSGSPPLTLSLPIGGGSISPDLSRGVLLGESGFALRQDGPLPEQQRQARFIAIGVSLESDRLNAAINLGTGLLGGGLLAAVDFNGVPAQADPATGSIAAQGAIATLDASVAAALNDTFASPKGKAGVFTGGEPLAAVSFTTQTR